MSDGISIREFGRREKCSDTLVRKALKSGHLKAFADGTLDPALVGTGWRKGNRGGANGGANSSRGLHNANPVGLLADETPAQAAERIVFASGANMDLAEAERVKENYLALLRQLEYDQKSGAVVPVVDVAKAVADNYAKVRTRLLAIPAEQAPRLHRCKTPVEVQDILRAIVVEALEELAGDRTSSD